MDLLVDLLGAVEDDMMFAIDSSWSVQEVIHAHHV